MTDHEQDDAPAQTTGDSVDAMTALCALDDIERDVRALDSKEGVDAVVVVGAIHSKIESARKAVAALYAELTKERDEKDEWVESAHELNRETMKAEAALTASRERVTALERLVTDLVEWARAKKDNETLHRPDVNIYKEVLVATWDQIIDRLVEAEAEVEVLPADTEEGTTDGTE